ncbi:MAG: NADH:flavin oxidoreductase [Oscillospiraceae bacterium]|nr:NADH:flavin oxidoreductase [Oscillospiraceae bacterium]
MDVIKYPHLFTPMRIRGTYFKNRIFSAPQGFYNDDKGRYHSEAAVAFYERKAIGGFASVAVGDCIVDAKTGKNLPWLVDMEDIENLNHLSKVAHAITRNGAVASAELAHDGMFSVASMNEYGTKLYGPIEGEFRYGHVEALTEEMILELIEKFGKAAAFAKQCGFNMVTIHAGHGWLPHQFMSHIFNKRTDKWGGSFENRMRFPLAIIESVRKAVGENFPIEFRFSGSEVAEGGYGIEEGVKIAQAIDGKVDIIHVSAGVHDIPSTFIVVHPSMFLEDGVNSKYAREIKKHVTKSLVATVGAFTDPQHMEDFIASGGADIINLARQSLADPDFPLKARTGREA